MNILFDSATSGIAPTGVIMSSSWSKRAASAAKAADVFLFTGRAYPQVVEGSNKTRFVTSSRKDREAFYRDPAVVLSDENMDQFNGTEGAPLCVEHNLKHVVGTVHHTWLGDGDKRSLKITGRIPRGPSHPFGEHIVQEIRAGRYKGLSVGYGTDLISNSRKGTEEVSSKCFREISLVKEPFFDDCHLSWGVDASKTAINNPNYNSNDPDDIFYIEILEMSETPTSASASAGSGQPTAVVSPGGGNEIPASKAAQNAVPPQELLREVDRLQTQLNEVTKANEIKRAEEEAKAKRLAYLEDKERREAAEYALNQKPKFERYVEEMKASKIPLTPEQEEGFKQAFCDPQFKAQAATFEAQLNQMVELRASKKATDDKYSALEQQHKQTQEYITKSHETINNSRTQFANALSTPAASDAAALEDEQRRRQVDVTASARSTSLKLNHIMCPMPSIAERDFLKEQGFTSEVNVNASIFDSFGGGRPYVSSVPAPPEHRNLRDKNGDLMLPNSARYQKGNDVIFAWMCANKDLRDGDLSDVARMSAKLNTYNAGTTANCNIFDGIESK